MSAFKLALLRHLIAQQEPLWRLPDNPLDAESWTDPGLNQFPTATTEYSEVSR